jgi:hypothetical protein
MDTEDEPCIVRLPVEHRPALDDGQFLRGVPHTHCRHFNGPFEVDADAASCKCLRCGEAVSPIFVLEQLMNQESLWMRSRRAYQDEMLRLQTRSRTKCERCGHMTRISGR